MTHSALRSRLEAWEAEGLLSRDDTVFPSRYKALATSLPSYEDYLARINRSRHREPQGVPSLHVGSLSARSRATSSAVAPWLRSLVDGASLRHVHGERRGYV